MSYGGGVIPPEKLAWMAAILDIQGRIHRKDNQARATPQLVLRVDSSHLSVIGELCRLTGGSVEPRPPAPGKEWDRKGCTEHCAAAHVHVEIGSQPSTGRWTVTGAAAAVVLHNVIPYMLTDRGMEAMMTEALENVNLAGRSGNNARRAVRRLAQLGWVLPEKIAAQAAETGLLEVIPAESRGRLAQRESATVTR
jgi:hypothetical protein